MDSVNKWLTLAANLGVIAGILFLAIELRQNNQLIRASAVGATLETRMTRADQVIMNNDLAALLVKNQSGDELSEQETMVLDNLHLRSILGWQKDYLLYLEGILDEELLQTNIPLMKFAFGDTRPTYSSLDHWEGWKAVSVPAFREFMESCILSDCESF